MLHSPVGINICLKLFRNYEIHLNDKKPASTLDVWQIRNVKPIALGVFDLEIASVPKFTNLRVSQSY